MIIEYLSCESAVTAPELKQKQTIQTKLPFHVGAYTKLEVSILLCISIFLPL